jgi:hypothetical protein
MSLLLSWRGLLLLLVLGSGCLFGPPLWDAMTIRPEQRVAPLKERIQALDDRIKANPTPATADLKEIATLEKGRIDTEQAMRATAVQAIAGLFVVITAWIAWLNRKTANEKQIADRFSAAVGQLGNENIHVRLGGIYALEQIAKDDTEKYYWLVIETLTSYVRERSPYPPKTAPKPVTFVAAAIASTQNSDSDSQEPIPPLPTDIQAVMTVLARRQHHYKHRLEPHRLDLRKVDLRGLQLPPKAELRGIDFLGANLQRAVLREANLQQAKLWKANLQQAVLGKANLQQADLGEANLQQAVLESANLQQAVFWSANLQQAKLWSANLQQANIEKANLQGTRFKETEPKWVEKLGKRETVGLTWEQVNQAASYTEELLPDYLLEQLPSGESGQQEES